jgi:dolichol-phosphate mannosyltransferase
VLPAFNEEANIGPMIEAALTTLPELAERYEVIVVDDGSRDGTADVAQDWMRRHHPAVRLLAHDGNRGYGAAIRTGLRHARGDLVFYTDADRQFDIAELAYFLPLAREHDLVIGFRVYRYDPLLRSLVSWVYNRMVGLLFRVRVRDVDCAFKLLRREIVDKLALESDDFFIDTEIVAGARRWNFTIAQKAVRHYPRPAGETTVGASDVPRTLRTILHMWRRMYASGRRPTPKTGPLAYEVLPGSFESGPGAAAAVRADAPRRRARRPPQARRR